jgi:hypothetical protein
MKKTPIIFACGFSAVCLLAQTEHKTPAQIAKELEDAENQFNRAKELFIPWYTGSLQAPGATNVPPGLGFIQPYVYLTENYASFDSERKSRSLSSSLVSLNPSASLQFGITDNLDIAIGNLQGFVNWQHGQSGGGFGDINVSLGFPICFETIHVPAMRFIIREIFPTGQFNYLNSNGYNLSATGGGSYQTYFGLSLSKTTFWRSQHPLRLRLAATYTIPSCVCVHGFNTYGGGYKTNAKVRPGNIFFGDIAFELSLTQRWVLASDFVYTFTNETTYSGYAGVKGDGSPASLGSGYSDSISIAPALEYNWSENLGIIGGVWFSVYGRNSLNFVSGVFSVAYTFEVKR